MAPELPFPAVVFMVPVALFGLAIVIGVILRWARTPRGTRSRFRHERRSPGER